MSKKYFKVVVSGLYVLSSYFRKELKGKYFKVNILLVSFVLLTNNPHISVDDQNTGLFLTHATSWT